MRPCCVWSHYCCNVICAVVLSSLCEWKWPLLRLLPLQWDEWTRVKRNRSSPDPQRKCTSTEPSVHAVLLRAEAEKQTARDAERKPENRAWSQQNLCGFIYQWQSRKEREPAAAKTSLRGADVVFFNLISPPHFLLLLLQAGRLFYAVCVKLKTSGEKSRLGVTALLKNWRRAKCFTLHTKSPNCAVCFITIELLEETCLCVHRLTAHSRQEQHDADLFICGHFIRNTWTPACV